MANYNQEFKIYQNFHKAKIILCIIEALLCENKAK